MPTSRDLFSFPPLHLGVSRVMSVCCPPPCRLRVSRGASFLPSFLSFAACSTPSIFSESMPDTHSFEATPIAHYEPQPSSPTLSIHPRSHLSSAHPLSHSLTREGKLMPTLSPHTLPQSIDLISPFFRPIKTNVWAPHSVHVITHCY